MIAVDTNLLVQAHQRECDLHLPATRVVRTLAEAATPWAICHHSLVEFYGVVTQGKLWREPSTPAQALDQIAAWRESPSLRVLFDTPTCLDHLAMLAVKSQVRGGMIHDARIAACCLTHGVRELWTVDRDFSRFPGLRTRNPLV